jgi:hypothetical protein
VGVQVTATRGERGGDGEEEGDHGDGNHDRHCSQMPSKLSVFVLLLLCCSDDGGMQPGVALYKGGLGELISLDSLID